MLFQLLTPDTPPSLRGPLLVDENGLPRYWVTIWSTLVAAHLAESTQIKKLRHIEDLYRHADRSFGQASLDNALGTFDDEVLASILESWFITIRNQPTTTESDQKRWDSGVGFVSSVLGWISKNDAN